MPDHFRPASFDWNKATLQHRDCLPHLRQSNVVYFVTFRLADSLPQSRLDELREKRVRWLALHPPPHTPSQEAQYRQLWTAPIENLLDQGHGQCVLREPQYRKTLEDTIRHDDGISYQLGDFVIMPNHVHALLHVLSNNDLSKILQAWKSISARRINRMLGRHGSLWQPEPFDHIVRDHSHWKKFIRYIQQNPIHLRLADFTLGRGSLLLEQ